MIMDAQEKQILVLKLLLQISKRTRDASRFEEIGFLAVNETKQIISYRQAALWIQNKGVLSVSGLPSPDPGAPYVQWLTSLFRSLKDEKVCRVIGPSAFPGLVAETWKEWLPLHAVIAPVFFFGKRPAGYLLLAKDTPWEENEIILFNELCSIYAHGFKAFTAGRSLRSDLSALFKKRVFWIGTILFLILLLFIPVRLSVQAQAEVAPKDPFIVRSPMDGNIDSFLIRPNQPVRDGQILFTFDRSNLKTRMDVAAQSYEVAAEEYRQVAQMAVEDEKARNVVESRRGKMKEKETELSYSRHLFGRIEVKSPRAGIAVFADPNDWIGRNVSVGERIITIADPSKVEMLIYLPVSDAIQIEPGGVVTLYLTSDPQKPREGRLSYISYKPEITPSGIAAYRLKADFIEGETLPRVGLTGVAKIYGPRVTVAYYIFRRPLTAFRQWLGW
jgi:hypothetical protein